MQPHGAGDESTPGKSVRARKTRVAARRDREEKTRIALEKYAQHSFKFQKAGCGEFGPTPSV